MNKPTMIWLRTTAVIVAIGATADDLGAVVGSDSSVHPYTVCIRKKRAKFDEL